MSEHPTTLATWCIPIAAALRKHCVDAEALFTEVGLDIQRIYEPNLRFPVSRMTRLWNRAAELSGNPAFSLEVARLCQPGSFQSLGAALMASTSLRDALLRMARYSRLVSNAADVVVREEAGVLSMAYEECTDGVEVSPHALMAFMAAGARFSQLLCMEPIVARRVCLPCPRPADIAPWREIFGPNLEFDQAICRVELDAEASLRPLPGGDASIARLQDQVLTEYLTRLDAGNVVDQVRRTILRQLPSGEPALADVADELSSSTNRLQRALASEGKTFKQLLSDTRRELAETWVSHSSTPLTNIAFDLGFAEQASFTRAFKRWTGMSPSAYRERAAAAR